MADADELRRFLFEDSPVRGYVVRLDATWKATAEHHGYPPVVRGVLGEAMAATALLAGTMKFDGRLTLQVQGEGPLHLLVTQCTDGLAMRGVARFRGAVPAGTLDAITGGGRVTVTVESTDQDTRYQGVVPLLGEGLAEGLEEYFARSEQLPTRLWLAADGEGAAGLLLQQLPTGNSASAEEDPVARQSAQDLWERVCALAGTVTPAELLRVPVEDLLHRLFHEENVRLFAGSPVSFRCACSRERTAGLLRALGRQEVEEIIAQDGEVTVTCEFCNRAWRFDAIDAGTLFTVPAPGSAKGRLH
jgi:molecular chaperone Hsp33